MSPTPKTEGQDVEVGDAAARAPSSLTPGPWSISVIHENGGYNNDGSIVVVPPRQGEDYGGPIAHVLLQRHGVKRGHTWKASDAIRDANARLIAAAPDLLEALQGIIDWADLALRNPQEFDSHGVRNLDGPAFDTARAAIAKAQGGAS